MKKMQCEVCGGTTIKKIGESMFECQSCGVQYGKEEVQKLLVEVTGTVKIDHSQEVDNTIKRAEQFYEQGDTEKAEEYYNKALDMDPENTVANVRVREINAQEADGTFNFIKRDISPEDGIKMFLNSLNNQTDIVPDIYKEVEIISTHEAFYLTTLYKGSFKGRYTGTSCYKKEVPYTDYEKKQERLSNGTYVTRQVPVTKYRTEIERVPASGFYDVDLAESFLLSDRLYKELQSTKNVEFPKKGKDGEGITTAFENFLGENVRKILDDSIEVKYSELEERDGKVFYDGTAIDVAAPQETAKRAKRLFLDSTMASCRAIIRCKIPGDFCEDIDYNHDEQDISTVTTLIPIQIIEYAYKGEFYIVALILNKELNGISMTYPLYKSLDVIEKEEETQNLTSKKSDLSTIVLFSFLAAVGSFIAMVIGTMIIGEAAVVIPPIVIAACVLWIISSAIKNAGLNKQIKTATEERNNKLSSINSLHGKVLLETSTAFFKEYENTHSVESARNAAITANNYSVNIEEVFVYGCEFSSKNVSKTTATNNGHTVEQTNSNSYLSNNNLTYTLKSIGDNKIQVIAALREALDIGLAEAKEIADSAPTNITYKDLATANRGNQKLTDCGCVVETED